MKKYIFLVVILVAIVASSNVGFAQTDNNRYEIRSHKSVSPMVRNTREASSCAGWGTFTNFSATDMNGVTHDIQSYLDQGKFVVVEFFCAWSAPDWTYHQTGLLESLYNTYGDGGSEEFIVLMIEVELSNTEAQITGTTTGQTQTGVSQGDFTNGGTNPVPIINATENLSIWVSLYEGFVPSVYLFCPSGYVHDIYDQEYYTTNAIYNFATSFCPAEESLPNIDVTKPEVVHAGEPASFSSCVISLTDVTYAWTFEDGTPETSTDANVDVVWNTPGMHRISLTVTNENGPIEFPDSVDVMDCSPGISTFPFVEDFENGQGCWNFISANTENDDLFGLKEYEEGMHGAVFSSFNNADNYNQYIISPQLRHAYELKLSFKYKKYNDSSNQSTGENFYVKYSTTTSDTSNFITLGSMITANSNSWETYTRTLPADAKYFMINYNSDYQYGLLIDDLTIESAVYWSCDFEGDEIWTFGNDQPDGNVQWQIVTPDTYSEIRLSDYMIPFIYDGDTLCDTPEHWAVVDLISQHEQLGGPGQVAESPYIEFSGIDLSNTEHPQLRFRQIYMHLNTVETLIRVSTDGGNSWTDHIVNPDVQSNKYGIYFYTKGNIDIFEATGYQNVSIRFYMNSEGSGADEGYGWELDDIQIIEAPQCDLKLQEARISMFGYIDYRNVPDDFRPTITDPEERREAAYHYYDPYSQSPRKQWATESGYAAFNVEVSSYGYDTVTPMARITIVNPNDEEIYDKVSSGIRGLAINERDTIDFFNSFSFYFEDIESFEDIVIGRYTVDFYVFADGIEDADTTDNYATQYFDITDKTFSLSYDEPTESFDYLYYVNSSSGDEYGMSFTYGYQPEEIIEVDVYIDSITTPGAMAQAIIYKYNDDGVPAEIIGSSDTLVITSDMPGSWVNFPLNGYVNSDTAFMVAIRGIWIDGQQTFAVGTSDVLTSKGHKSCMRFQTQGDSWYYGAPQLAIRVRELTGYNIEVLTSNQEYGYVTGGGTYEEGSEAIITAYPYQGYNFFLWDAGYWVDEFQRYNNENSRTIAVTSDSTFTAAFVRDEGTERENVLIELFSYQSDIQHGAVAAKVLDDMEASDTMNIIVINHQFNSRDPYYYEESDNRFAEAKEDVFGESAEYGASPNVFFDGYLFAAGARSDEMSSLQDLYTFFYSNVKNVKSLYNLTADITLDEENDRMFTLNVTAEKLSDYYDGDQIVIIAALTEDIDYDWGVAGKMNNIVRLMYPNSEGTEVTFDNNNLFSTEFSINISDEYDITKCKLVVWIENHTQGRIMQSKRFNKLYRDTFEITVLSSNEAYGSVSGGGTYEEGSIATLTAMPNGGYLFDSWEDGNFDNPREITVTSDSTFVADFVKCEITQAIDTVVPNFVTVGDHTFYSTGRYSFEIQHETDCDTIFDINLTVLAEPEPFDIGPNPTEKILNIKSDGFISFVEFYSTAGQLIMRKEVNGNFAECDVESLVSGIYIVRIYGDESTLPSVYKIVKE